MNGDVTGLTLPKGGVIEHSQILGDSAASTSSGKPSSLV